MASTSLTLIQKLAEPARDQAAWERFVDLYAPLLHFWALKNGLRQDEAADLVQDVLIELLQRLPQFEYDQQQSFRGWLRRIIHNRAIDSFRRKGRLPAQLASGVLSNLDAADHVQSFSDDEYRSQLAGRATRFGYGWKRPAITKCSRRRMPFPRSCHASRCISHFRKLQSEK
jgi:RNA polymerase sigma-70 factor (ECF subfamily)